MIEIVSEKYPEIVSEKQNPLSIKTINIFIKIISIHITLFIF